MQRRRVAGDLTTVKGCREVFSARSPIFSPQDFHHWLNVQHKITYREICLICLRYSTKNIFFSYYIFISSRLCSAKRDLSRQEERSCPTVSATVNDTSCERVRQPRSVRVTWSLEGVPFDASLLTRLFAVSLNKSTHRCTFTGGHN